MMDSLVGWRTSVGVGGKAHFYDVTGAVACGDRKGIWPGARLADLFTRPTRATMDEDHICRYCAEKHERTCLCWTCQARRRAKVLARARKKSRSVDRLGLGPIAGADVAERPGPATGGGER